mgnify:FL=1
MSQFRRSAKLSAIALGLLLAGCGDGQQSDWATKMKALLGAQSAAPATTAETDSQQALQKELDELKKKAVAGDAKAQTRLGAMYYFGEGVPKDNAKAAEWFRKAAEQGQVYAQYNLGSMYARGEGVRKDATKAADWYRKTAEQGYDEAQYNLGVRYEFGEGVPKDDAKAMDWYRKAAEQGNFGAQRNLGVMYYFGKGVPKDDAKAAEWYRKAAEQGDVEAQYNLGVMYAKGEGVPKDATKAAEWFRKAAEQGYVEAQKNLGVMYANGEGVPKDGAKAMDWYRKAAEQGDAWAQYILGLAYDQGEGVPKDSAKAVEWYQKSAASGQTGAQLILGGAYFLGKGVATDNVLAYAWSNLAAAQGNEGGAEIRDMAASRMTPAEIAEAQRLSSGWKVGMVLARESDTAGAGKQSASPGSPAIKNTGTAFIVNTTGHAITNHHVVDGCTEVRAEGRDDVVKVVTSDVVNDLALLQIPGTVFSQATIASDPAKLRQGEDIVVFGFPLNAVLSSGGNLTPGVVSALTGLGNNTNQIQITAPIQPGSSGSPVINKKGEVVGVVAMKLSDAQMAKATGQIGQNVNFAVSGQTLKTFLDTHKVEYRSGGIFSFGVKSTADLADEARKWTLVVECWN